MKVVATNKLLSGIQKRKKTVFGTANNPALIKVPTEHLDIKNISNPKSFCKIR